MHPNPVDAMDVPPNHVQGVVPPPRHMHIGHVIHALHPPREDDVHAVREGAEGQGLPRTPPYERDAFSASRANMAKKF